MNDKERKELETLPETDDVEVQWGETKQERIIDDSPRHKSERHNCKGRDCATAFDKL